MRKIWMFAFVAVVAGGCGNGDDVTTLSGPKGLASPTDLTSSFEPSPSPPRGLSTMGGSEVSRSKSFVLVTTVSAAIEHASSSQNLTLRSGLAAQ